MDRYVDAEETGERKNRFTKRSVTWCCMHPPTDPTHSLPPFSHSPYRYPQSYKHQPPVNCDPRTLSVMCSRHKHNSNKFNRERKIRNHLASVPEVWFNFRGGDLFFHAPKSHWYIFFHVAAQKCVFGRQVEGIFKIHCLLQPQRQKLTTQVDILSATPSRILMKHICFKSHLIIDFIIQSSAETSAFAINKCGSSISSSPFLISTKTEQYGIYTNYNIIQDSVLILCGEHLPYSFFTFYLTTFQIGQCFVLARGPVLFSLQLNHKIIEPLWKLFKYLAQDPCDRSSNFKEKPNSRLQLSDRVDTSRSWKLAPNICYAHKVWNSFSVTGPIPVSAA